MNRDFPVTAEGVKQLLDRFKQQRAEEDREKEKEKEEVAAMAQELTIFQQKKRKEISFPPFSEIEKVVYVFYTCRHVYTCVHIIIIIQITSTLFMFGIIFILF